MINKREILEDEVVNDEIQESSDDKRFIDSFKNILDKMNIPQYIRDDERIHLEDTYIAIGPGVIKSIPKDKSFLAISMLNELIEAITYNDLLESFKVMIPGIRETISKFTAYDYIYGTTKFSCQVGNFIKDYTTPIFNYVKNINHGIKETNDKISNAKKIHKEYPKCITQLIKETNAGNKEFNGAKIAKYKEELKQSKQYLDMMPTDLIKLPIQYIIDDIPKLNKVYIMRSLNKPHTFSKEDKIMHIKYMKKLIGALEKCKFDYGFNQMMISNIRIWLKITLKNGANENGKYSPLSKVFYHMSCLIIYYEDRGYDLIPELQSLINEIHQEDLYKEYIENCIRVNGIDITEPKDPDRGSIFSLTAF